jgi:putative endonuclease
VAQLASALAWGARGRLFESDHPDECEGADSSAPYLLFKFMYVVYILHSSRIGKFYTGQTVDLNRRMKEHNRGKTSFSVSGMPWLLVFSKICSSRSQALKLEKFIKKRGAVRFLKENNIIVG